ncbi:MAG TPA: DUF4920 domain-containing protein [Tepidisphaeraceae bacterium]|nr:DUF4920 domain-containing protein [Tepidisphaeraceae bacterium]
MKLSHWLLGGLLAFGGVATADEQASPAFEAYGEAMVEDARPALSLKDVLAKADDLKDQTVRVSGTVQDVCRSKGCWIRMNDEAGNSLFVKFTCPVEGRLIPVDAVGKTAVVEGKLMVKMISEDEAKHYAEESGKPEEELAKIKGPQRQVSLAGPSARIWK